MGLDMYLYRDTYVGNDWEKNEAKQAVIKVPGVDQAKVSSVTEQVAYWRKVNAIHAWFVKNVQKGNDDCGRYPVSKEQIQELLQTVETILANHEKAAELLPPQTGFFFGSADIDEWYWEDLKETKKMLQAVLDAPKSGQYGGVFYYRSSW